MKELILCLYLSLFIGTYLQYIIDDKKGRVHELRICYSNFVKHVMCQI